jgi:hypothetical protein
LAAEPLEQGQAAALGLALAAFLALASVQGRALVVALTMASGLASALELAVEPRRQARAEVWAEARAGSLAPASV